MNLTTDNAYFADFIIEVCEASPKAVNRISNNLVMNELVDFIHRVRTESNRKDDLPSFNGIAILPKYGETDKVVINLYRNEVLVYAIDLEVFSTLGFLVDINEESKVRSHEYDLRFLINLTMDSLKKSLTTR